MPVFNNVANLGLIIFLFLVALEVSSRLTCLLGLGHLQV
jgi:Kef-type K+ transport system membrane component KefB